MPGTAFLLRVPQRGRDTPARRYGSPFHYHSHLDDNWSTPIYSNARPKREFHRRFLHLSIYLRFESGKLVRGIRWRPFSEGFVLETRDRIWLVVGHARMQLGTHNVQRCEANIRVEIMT